MMKMHYPWHIQLFGGLQVHHNNSSLARFETRKTAALLAYLAALEARLTMPSLPA